MLDQKNNAPRRYFVDEHGHRVMIGLSFEETIEFETLDGSDVPREDSPAVTAAGRSDSARDRRWSELYGKHDVAWKLWMAQSRAEQATSLSFVNHG